MSASKIFSPFRIVLLFALVILCGILVLPALDVDLLPAEKSSQLQIYYSLPNSNPTVVEQQITSILEGAFSQLSGLKHINSSSDYGRGNIDLYFDESADMAFKKFEVAALIRQISPKLPSTASYPAIAIGINNNQRKNVPFLIYSINAPQQPFRIKEVTENTLKKSLAELQGISKIQVSGTENLQITIQFDHNKCEAWGVSPLLISNSLKILTSNTYVGSLNNEKGEQFFLRIPSAIATLSDIENMLLATSTGEFIHLKDVAKVFVEEQDTQSYFRINGKNSVSMAITAREGENKIVLAQQIMDIVNLYQYQLPKGYELQISYNSTDFLQRELSINFLRIGLSLSILILFILLAYRSWRHMIVLFCSLVASLALTVVLAWFTDIHIHLYTIAGLTIAFGIMLDNTIVMVDYYRQFRTRKVFPALLASTLTTIAALCLVFFFPATQKNNLADFSLIIVLALVSSLLVALTLTPGLHVMLTTRHPEQQHPKKKKFKLLRNRLKREGLYYSGIRFIGTYRKIFIPLVILLFGLPLFMLPQKWEGNQWYHRWYNASIGSGKYQNDIRPVTDKWLGGALYLFADLIFEKSGYRIPEKTELYIIARLTYGNTIHQMNSILQNFEEYLASVEGIDKYITHISSGQRGSIVISFKKAYAMSGLPYQLKSKLIDHSLDWGGVEWNIFGVGQGFSNGAGLDIPAYRVTMKGYNYDELERQADILAEKLKRHKRIQKINTNGRLDYNEKKSSEYVLEIDNHKMALAGANKYEILAKVIALSKPTQAPHSVTLDNQFYQVMLKEKSSESFSKYDLFNNPLTLDAHKKVRLKDFSSMDLQATSNSIRREDRQYIRVVSFEYMGSFLFGRRYLKEILKEMKSEMPIGYTATLQRWNRGWGGTSHKYILIFVLILVNFFICSILFENLKEPFIIISMVPISFIGLFLTFYLGNFYFDQGGYAAFVMLGGLVVNAAIFIVNDFNNLRKKRRTLSYNRLLIKATTNRARTILITIISTCCGLIPFLLGGQNEVFWFSLAAGTIGGLLFSLFAVFVVLPVLLWKKEP